MSPVGSKTGSKKGFTTRGRSWARRLAMQALYQWQLSAQDLATIDAQFRVDKDFDKVEVRYFEELLHRIPERRERIDAALLPYLDRSPEQVDPVEKALLWIGAYELAERPDVPYRVVINEAVELAKRFGAEQSHRFVNGVLDKAARRLRAAEFAGHRPV